MKNARLGQDGDVDALKDLGMQDVQPLPHQTISKADIKKFKKHFQMVGEVSLAAKQLGHTTLHETCEQMLGMVHYAAKYKLKKNLVFKACLHYTLDEMDTLVSSIKTFLNFIGDTNGAGQLVKMKQLIQKARNGDKHAIAFFCLEEIPQFTMQAVRQVPRFYKLVNLYQCYKMYAQVGKFVNNTTFTYVAQGVCSYIAWTANEAEPTERVVSIVDRSDICTLLPEELNFIQEFVKLCRVKVFKYEGKRLEDELNEMQEEVDDPSYQPEEEGESSESS